MATTVDFESLLRSRMCLSHGASAICELTQPAPALKEEPRADVRRYDRLREAQP